MSDHLPECLHDDDTYGLRGLCICDELRACEQRVRMEDDDYAYVAAQSEADGRRRGWSEALIAARAALAMTHRPVPVIECGGTCGWGKDCPECGSESNRIVGYVCDACCNSFGDHAYCDDLHYEDTPLHHQDGQMWSGPHCPTLAVIDALREKP